jgi:uncharacterized protein (TIGR02594 family)
VATLTRITPFSIAAQFIGCAEAPGAVSNPQVLAMLQLVDESVHDDETPWCSAFVHYVAWLCDIPRSDSLAARSWLSVGTPIALSEATAGFDVVVLSRGANPAPASVRHAPGHVGFFAMELSPRGMVRVLGGNQRDQVCFADYPIARVLGLRRLA